MSERLLRARFNARWQNIVKASEKAKITLPIREDVWNLILRSFRNGFKCEYCKQKLLIIDHNFPYCQSFSIDHRTSIDVGGSNEIKNLAIVCTRCNLMKGTMEESTFKTFIAPHLAQPEFLNKAFSESVKSRLADKLNRVETGL